VATRRPIGKPPGCGLGLPACARRSDPPEALGPGARLAAEGRGGLPSTCEFSRQAPSAAGHRPQLARPPTTDQRPGQPRRLRLCRQRCGCHRRTGCGPRTSTIWANHRRSWPLRGEPAGEE
jgi:hypothetical protein